MSLIKVRYKGLSDVREITKKQWASVGVVVDSDTVWDRSNGWAVVVDSNERLEEVLREQGNFQISALDDAGGEKIVARALDPNAEEGDVVVDGDTGQAEVNKRKKDAEAQAGLARGAVSEASTTAHGTGRGSSTSGDTV